MKAAGTFVGLCWAVLIVVWLISALSVKPTKERQPLSGRLLYVGLTAVVAVLLNGGIRTVHLTRVILPHTLAAAIVADIIVMAGFAIAIWARVVLGGKARHLAEQRNRVQEPVGL